MSGAATMPKLEALAFEHARTWAPWRRKGWREALRLVSRHADNEDTTSDLRHWLRCRYLPDGWFLTRADGGRTLWALEIEDTSTLKPEKVEYYLGLFDALDADSRWDLRLVTADRYGRCTGDVPLGLFWVADLVKRASGAEVRS